jgi:hypothetical protein
MGNQSVRTFAPFILLYDGYASCEHTPNAFTTFFAKNVTLKMFSTYGKPDTSREVRPVWREGMENRPVRTFAPFALLYDGYASLASIPQMLLLNFLQKM